CQSKPRQITMRADGEPSGSTVARAMAVALRTDAVASAIHDRTSGSGSSGRGSGRAAATMRSRAGAVRAGDGRRPRRLLRARQPGGRADLAELAGVVVPVVVEQRADVHRDGNLVLLHDLLEERDLRLAALELGV